MPSYYIFPPELQSWSQSIKRPKELLLRQRIFVFNTNVEIGGEKRHLNNMKRSYVRSRMIGWTQTNSEIVCLIIPEFIFPTCRQLILFQFLWALISLPVISKCIMSCSGLNELRQQWKHFSDICVFCFMWNEKWNHNLAVCVVTLKWKCKNLLWWFEGNLYSFFLFLSSEEHY